MSVLENFVEIISSVVYCLIYGLSEYPNKLVYRNAPQGHFLTPLNKFRFGGTIQGKQKVTKKRWGSSASGGRGSILLRGAESGKSSPQTP
ncbi:MAG: hypothetical protein AAB575_05835 [Patescibacteria group bacterium]